MPQPTPTDLALISRFILEKFDQLTALVADCDDDLANTRLEVAGSNSAVAILVHCCGMLREWSSTINVGVEIDRDRDAEFLAAMPVAEALTLAATTRSAFLDDQHHTDLTAAPARPRATMPWWGATCEGSLIHIYEELSQHLGHAELTLDIVRGQAVASQDSQP